MLADTILAECGGRADAMLGGGITALAKSIQNAGRFDLAPGVIVSAYAVRRSSLKSQIRALSLCRLPFATTWFEWPGSDPVYKPFQEDTVSSDAPAPMRMGALVETDESRQRGVMTFAWSHRNIGLSICPLAASFDWRGNAEEVPDVELDGWRQSGLSELQINERIFTRFRNGTAVQSLRGVSNDELVQERRRVGVIWSPVMDGFARMIIGSQGALPGPGTPEWSMWGGNLSGEPNSLQCVILLLNSRNATEATQVDLSAKLNKARLRSGKPPLLDHTTIRIKLSRAMTARAGSGTQREATRFHVVRGHPKIRKSGVFWWSDHGRGDPARGSVDQTYRVDP